MFSIILDTIKRPHLLAQCLLIKTSFIRKVFWFLALIVAIPYMISNVQMLFTAQKDLVTISSHLPSFTSQDGVVTGLSGSTTSSAIQTDTTYFLYDIENKVDANTKEELLDHNTFSIMVTKMDMAAYFANINLERVDAKTATVDTSSLQDLLASLHNTLYYAMLMTPIIVLLVNALSVLLYNFFFALAAQVIFMLSNRLVKFKHLFRVSLFSSILPYTLLAILKLFHVTVPFEALIILAYTLYIQFLVLRVTLRR